MIPAEAAAGIARLPPGPIGVAVSGGSDSLALLLMLREAGREVVAVTVDHRLRAGSAAEAERVAGLCDSRGIGHTTLVWEAPHEPGNLQARARQARRRLIVAWARDLGIRDIALGHTLDDQAETVLLRLARGSGVDGLAGMMASSTSQGLCWHRPFLGVRRAALRDWLTGLGVGWIDDPSNADLRFERVRIREAMPFLATLGLGPERLAATALSMARARAALEHETRALARTCLIDGGAGDLVLDPARLDGVPEELRLRLLASALGWVSGEVYRPRLARLQAALRILEAGEVGHGLTLHGCVLRARGGHVAIRREPSRVASAVPLAEGEWDGRWRLVGAAPEGEGLTIGALGAGGLRRIGAHPPGLAREALATTPAIWRKG